MYQNSRSQTAMESV